MGRSAGYQTKNRKMILDYLKENKDTTVTASDIFSFLEESHAGVNITTVYRYLERLTTEGSVMKFASEKGEKAVYKFVEPQMDCNEHLHLQCIKCGKIIHLNCEFMDAFEQHVESHHAFHILCDKSVIFGMCNACQQEEQ